MTVFVTDAQTEEMGVLVVGFLSVYQMIEHNCEHIDTHPVNNWSGGPLGSPTQIATGHWTYLGVSTF